jgi:hypothetical protein
LRYSSTACFLRAAAEVLEDLAEIVRDQGRLTKLIDEYLQQVGSQCPVEAELDFPQLSIVDLFGVIVIFFAMAALSATTIFWKFFFKDRLFPGSFSNIRVFSAVNSKTKVREVRSDDAIGQIHDGLGQKGICESVSLQVRQTDSEACPSGSSRDSSSDREIKAAELQDRINELEQQLLKARRGAPVHPDISSIQPKKGADTFTSSDRHMSPSLRLFPKKSPVF